MTLIIYCIYVLMSSFGNTFCLSDGNLPMVETPLGRVRGYWSESLDGRRFAAFEGIPFAKPPVGNLRFEEPQPVLPWTGIWEANTTQICIQVSIFFGKGIIGTEDCLYLNVYLPADFLNISSSKKLDVVVFIHGGGFTSGYGHLADPRILMDRDIILVTFNHRLYFFGFLSTQDAVIPGNNGLKDQVLAFKWVKDNIESFGGNRNSITLAGTSTGGVSVHLHYFSPLSRGLFTRGLSQSGTCALTTFTMTKSPKKNAKKLAVIAGCPEKPSEKLKECLKERPAKSLLSKTDIYYDYDCFPFVPFGPVIEKNSRQPFLDRDPYDMLKDGDVADAPWIVSMAANEGLIPAALYWSQLDEVDEMWPTLAQHFLHNNEVLTESENEMVAREILDYYLGPGERINKKNFKKFTQIFTDKMYKIPIEMAAKMQSKVTSPVYFYLFNYEEGENKAVSAYSRGNLTEGIAHGDDNIYFYGLFSEKSLSKKDKRMRNACQDMLYSYASMGKPSFDGSDIWKPTKSEELTYLNVAGPDNITLQKAQKATDLAPIDFWKKLGFFKNEHPTVKDEL